MRVSYDPAKRAKTLAERGLDFADAAEVFAGLTATIEDDRQDYGETRYQTYGLLKGRLVMLVWTERGAGRHIISMRKCNEREQARFTRHLG
ncbi:BrnT family toxin [Pacificimonas sp. ICDLI1SI03]